MDEAHGHAPSGLGLQHAGQAGQGARGARVDGIDRPHHDVAAHAQVEVGVQDDVDGVPKEVAHHDDRHRSGDAAHRDRRAQRAPLHVAQDHAQRRAGAQARDAFDQRAPVAAGRGRAHGLGRLQPHRRSDGGERAQQGGDRHHAQAHGHELGRHDMHEYRKAEHFVVQPHQQRAQPFPEGQPQQPATGGHRRDQLEVVQGDDAVGIAERLERGDLLALRRHQPRRDHVQQEGGHREEDRGQHRAQHLLLADLVVQHRVRHLVVAAVRRQSAEARELAAHGIHGRRVRHAGRELDRHAVERALHVQRRGELVGVEPEHAEGAHIGHPPTCRRRCTRATAPCP